METYLTPVLIYKKWQILAAAIFAKGLYDVYFRWANKNGKETR